VPFALIHCLAYHEAITADPDHPPKELLDEPAALAHELERRGDVPRGMSAVLDQLAEETSAPHACRTAVGGAPEVLGAA
jgi:hypothetical protein